MSILIGPEAQAMRMPCFRIRTLMIAVAVLAISLAALCAAPGWLSELLAEMAGLCALVAVFVHYGRKLGINALFR